MEYFWKAIACILIGVILWMILQKQNRDISILLSIALCCMITGIAAAYIKPVISLVWELSLAGDLDDSLLKQLLQAVGVGFVAEIAGRICTDAGNASIGAMARFLGSAAMLYCGIPMIRTLMTLIQDLVGVI